MDYLSYNLENARFVENTVLRRALRKHILKVSAALHAIEWNDSGDGAPDEDELIAKCISPADVLDQAIEDAEKAKRDLEEAILMGLIRRDMVRGAEEMVNDLEE